MNPTSVGPCARLVGALLVGLAAAVALLALPTGAGAQDPGTPQEVALAFESQVGDVTTQQLQESALATLADPRGWSRAGFTFKADPASPYRVILAEPDAVDLLCLPIDTGGTLSCQNGDVVALNAERWRTGVEGWSGDIDAFHQYQVNHEVGHLIGQFHPANRCPSPGKPEALMAPQSKGLEGCEPNVWPLDWEVLLASARPVSLAPGPEVEPENRAVNPGGGVPGTLPPGGAATSTAAPTTLAPDAAAPVTQVAPTTVDDSTSATLGDTPLTTPDGGAALDDPELSAGPASGPDSENSTLPLLALLVIVAGALVALIVVVVVRWRRTVHDAAAARDEVDADGDGGDGGDDDDDDEDDDDDDGEAGSEGLLAATGLVVPATEEAPEVLPGWRLRVTGGARSRQTVAWFVPIRWGAERADELASGLQALTVEADGPAPPTRAVAEAITVVLRAHPELRPRDLEGVGAVVVGADAVVAAAFGAAEVVELRSGLAKPARRQGVARLRPQSGSILEVDVAPTGDSIQRGRILVSESVPR